MTRRFRAGVVVPAVLLAIFVLAVLAVARGDIKRWFWDPAWFAVPRSEAAPARGDDVPTANAGAAATQEEDGKDRPRRVLVSPLAGRWYEADPKRLEAEIRTFLANVKAEPVPDLHALILPHAGYRYSGQTAAHGLKRVAGRRFARVVVLGPSHRLHLENLASVPDETHYATPLGEVPLDVEFITALKRHACFGTVPAAHRGEHSVQIQVPLLQVALSPFRLVPIVVGQLDRAAVREMAGVLRGLVDETTLVVVSSDFTHYGPNYGYVPFDADIPRRLEELDRGAYREIEKKDVDAWRSYLARTGATVCGRDPIAVLLELLPAASRPTLFRYDTSGALTGDHTNSVSYLAVGFMGTWKREPNVDAQPTVAPLTATDETRLLALARRTLAHALAHGRVPEAEELGTELTPAMKNIGAAFVTLRKGGQLRGCIGDIFAQRPLYRSVMLNAVHAARNDRRFEPVTAAELPDLQLEISALTTPVDVGSWRDIVIGRHGIVLRKNGTQAVFLPQVAPEQGWNLEQTLTRLAEKAGLAGDAWREGTSFLVFEARVFGEEKE
ncbi:MAG: AmmeMemoRadiSam system protein B [Planctomycetes bacterium]|nr:AmmeMemoRadiSam system protein B [Planctomycetota bacterium]